MKDQSKTKQVLIQEMASLRQRIEELEQYGSAQKRLEEALRVNEERYRMAQAIGHVGSWEYDLQTANFWGSDEAKRIYGFEPTQTDITTDQVEGCIPERERVHQALIDLIEKCKTYNLEFEIHPRNSTEPRIISSIGELHRDEHGAPSLVVGVLQDITDRKRLEEVLQQSEELHRVTIENILDPIFITDSNGKFTFICPNVPYVLGYSIKEVEAMGNIGALLGDPLRLFNLEELNKEGKITNIEAMIIPKGGIIRDYLVTVKKVSIKSGTILYVCRDVTERKQAEERIQASLWEKESLLREIHHRVKNNMQVISGLLDLQARSSGNPELTGMLNESQKRIRSMALIHERLYASDDLSRINMAGYLETLSQELFQSYKVNSRKIEMIVQSDGVYVDINKGIPCGLILNELISNAIKHAFPGDGPGKLQIIIRETKSAEIDIVVRDNGRGLPDDVDIHQPRTVGLYLVNGLVKNQLDGQIEVRRDNGTEFRIKFSL